MENMAKYAIPEKYLTWDVFKQTESRLLKGTIDRDCLSIIQRGGVFYLESRGCSDRAYKIAIRETKRIYPYLSYLYDVA